MSETVDPVVVERVAAGLTEAQRRVMLAFPPDTRGYGVDVGWPRSWPEIAHRANVAHASTQACMDRGLVEQSEWRGQSEFRYLTPLGLAVRARLLANTGEQS